MGPIRPVQPYDNIQGDQIVLAFIDESGDAGMKLEKGSSAYFCIVAVVFKDSFGADACDRGIAGLRLTLNKSSSYEFHFSHCPDSIKSAFIRTVSREEFSYHAFVIDKHKLLVSSKLNDPKQFYEFAVNIVCENAGELMKDAKVVIDKNGNREFLRRLESQLRKITNQSGERIINKAIMQDSKANNLVQLADMTCGAVARSITDSDHSYRNILKNRGREKRVQCWPK